MERFMLTRGVLKGVARWRIGAGLAVVGALLLFCSLLVGPYVQNWRLQQFLEQIAFAPAWQNRPPEAFVAAIVSQAAQLGLPVRTGQVRVMRSAAGVYIEVRYVVPVELYLYTVDLHFRPAAGAR